MDSNTLYAIVVIIAAVLVVEIYKREKNRVTANLHNDNLKQLLTITALEYKYSDLGKPAINDSECKLVEKNISHLVAMYEKGEIQHDALQKSMAHLLNKI